jgi:sec-independent protein translocase protein TatC
MALVPFPQKNALAEPEPDWDAQEDEGGKMSFLEHLDELRKRLIRSLIGVGIGFVIAVFFLEPMFEFVMLPMQQMLPPGQTLVYTEPGEAFFLQIKIAVIAGLLIASPLVFTQVWLFVAPGLYTHEKKMAIPFVVMSSVFFVAGAAFSHYIVFPIVWKFFAGFQYDYLIYMPRVESSFSTYLRLILACALTFQLPTLVLFLARMGMITPRFMFRNFKYAFMIIMVLAAILSPDGGGVGMMAMGGPVVLLYFFSIGLAWIFGKRRPKDDEES